MFAGEVQLDGLKLKASVLDRFDLPIAVRSGSIGTLRLKVLMSAHMPAT